MSGTVDTAGFLDTFRARGAAIADACTRCGDCFRACPMVEPAGLAAADLEETTGAIVDLITGGEGNAEAIRWADVCSGSGNCIPACQHGINPRFMVQLARGFARRNATEKAEKHLSTGWRTGFQNMSRGVRVLSRLQLPPETLARFAPSRAPRKEAPDVVFYTGCNVLKTPHIALLCLDIFDLLGVEYEVMGGVGQCCGVYQYRAGEVSLPNYELQFGAKPFDLNPFLIFLAERADQLAGLMKRRIEKRIALHERPVFPGVVDAVKKLLSFRAPNSSRSMCRVPGRRPTAWRNSRSSSASSSSASCARSPMPA